MDLGPEDRHIPRGREAELHPVSFNLQHHDFNIFANENSFALTFGSEPTCVILLEEGNSPSVMLAGEMLAGKPGRLLEMC